MKKVELLSPVGDFDCLKAAIQNGADAVYLGASNFNARYSAKNFTPEDLEKAINYTHIRNSKIYLTLNTLIKNNELNDAFNLAKLAYEFGIDGIIVQDLGFANTLIKNLPNLPIHASTQMTVTNLNGAIKLKKLGFKRIVLARELSLTDIKYICENSGIEIECFIHGALCISYSGQCLFSSMVGARSGNRGKCAQSCRLPYELMQNNLSIDKGYLLSPRDLCGLELLPDLIDAGVHSFKIEGRMKSPEYVATVTRIYRKYIDMVIESKDFRIDEKDIKDLKQVFNRGGFSHGHLDSKENKKLIFKDKPNNMGIYIGNVSNYNVVKGHITINLADNISIGDTVSFERETSKYKISELMLKHKNISSASSGQLVTIGRMKGNINIGDKIYKMSSKELSLLATSSYNNVEQKKIKLDAKLSIQEGEPITLSIKSQKIYENYKDISLYVESDIAPIQAINSPITKERIISQIAKTKDTPFIFDKIDIDLGSNLYLPNIGALNALRRNALSSLENAIIKKFKRSTALDYRISNKITSSNSIDSKQLHISLLLNNISVLNDYSCIENVDSIYIPLKYFISSKYSSILSTLSNLGNIYIYLPTVIRNNFKNLFMDSIERTLEKYNIRGFVISNIGTFELLEKYINSYEFIGNYTLNIFNSETFNKYLELGLNKVTLSPELGKDNLLELNKQFNKISECIVYGAIPLMTCQYCLLGKSNKCYPECKANCNNEDKYYLKDRLGFYFRVIPDNMQTVTTIYNSKINSVCPDDFDCINARIDILDETPDEINAIISKVKNGERLEGAQYTNGNLYRNI